MMLHIIILNWNGCEVTRDCLLSLYNNSSKDFDVVLVDNNSTDGSVPKLKIEFPFIKIIANSRNEGFAGGNNIGIKYALSQGAKNIVLLNNDTTVAEDFIERICVNLEKHPDVQVISPKIFYFDADLIWFAGGKKRLRSPMGAVHCGYKRVDNGRFEDEKLITFATACCVVIRSIVFDRIGLLDEFLFAYYEDLEFSLKLRKKGMQILFCPDVRVRHKIGESLKSSRLQPFKMYLMVRNRIIIQKRYASIIEWICFICSFVVGSQARMALRSLASRDRADFQAFMFGLFDGLFDLSIRDRWQ